MHLLRPFRNAGEAFLNLLYPPHCAICLAETPAREHLCPACRKSAPAIIAPLCQICSAPFSGQIDDPFACPNCRERRFKFDCAVAPYQREGVVKELIHRFKYRHQFHLRHVLGEWLAESLADSRLQSPPLDRIVPVPLHPARERERGFNQADILGEILTKTAGIPLLAALKRVRFTPTQTRLDREMRIENLRNAFRIRHNAEVRNLHLLLIDDVLTTGSTVDECARVLKDAGAASVRVATIARS